MALDGALQHTTVPAEAQRKEDGKNTFVPAINAGCHKNIGRVNAPKMPFESHTTPSSYEVLRQNYH